MNDDKLLIGTGELHEINNDEDLRIVDCRFDLMRPEAGRELFLAEHIPGAVFADLDQDLAAPVGPCTGRHPLPDPGVLAETFGRLGISARTRVIVYDETSGAFAARLWWLLRWLGHPQVSLLDGGIARWRASQLPMEAGRPEDNPTVFEPAPRPELVLETAEIVAAGESCAALQLVDARDANRFAGIAEPIDTVAGHIPGAINVPFSESLNDDGTWKSAAELQQLWVNALGGSDSAWSVMCGSGVTACHLAVSGLLAGLPEPRLYVGSWSEWITESSRPVAPKQPTRGSI